MPIRTKLIAIFIAFVIIPSVFVLGLFFSNTKDAFKNGLTERLETIADMKKDRVEEFFKDRKADLESFQAYDMIKDDLPVIARHSNNMKSPAYDVAYERLDQRMKNVQKIYGYRDVMLTDQKGTVVYASEEARGAMHIGRPLAGQESKAFEKGKAGVCFSDIFKDEAERGQSGMLAAAPLKGRDGAFIGVILLSVNMGPIYDALNDTKGMMKTGEMLIGKKEGDKVHFLSPTRVKPGAEPNMTRSIGGRVAVPMQEATQGKDGSGTVPDYRGKEVIAAWRYIPSLGWGIVAKIDAEEAFAPVKEIRDFAGTLVVVVLISGILAVLLISKTITEPISALRMGTEKIGTGNLDYKVGTKSKDEIGTLSRSIDRMAENLKKVTASRDELNREAVERKKAEERFRLMTKGVKEYAIVMLDPAGNVVDWNEGAERIKGYSTQEIIGKHFSCFYPSEDVISGKPGRELEQAAAMGSFEDEGVRVRKDGSKFFANAVITALRDEAGNLRGFSKVTRDITERKKAEDDIKRMNEELEQHVLERTTQLTAANKELEAFCYSVSHDLRSPLRSIDGFSQALMEDCAAKLDEKDRDSLTRVRAASQRMAQLIDDLLKLSRVTRGEMRHERIDLSALARTVAAELKTAQPGREVEFAVKDGLFARGDSQLMRVVVENLLGNAWKFTTKRAHAKIEFGETGEEGGQAFYVKDDGAGFDMAYKEKLFGPFQRLHSTTDFTGTGIGLATVQRIVARHGGRVWAEGKVEKGATFYFTIEQAASARRKEAA